MKARVPLFFTAVVLLTTLTIALGCSKAPNDSQIASDIQSKINADSGLQGKQLAVQAEKGSVTLSGVVETDAQRDAAARYASSEPGVKQVVNNLQIAPAAAAQIPQNPQAPAEEPKAASHHQKKSRKHADESDSESQQVAQQTPPPAAAPVSAPPPAPVAPPPPPPPQKVTIPSGTALAVRLVDPIDSEKNQIGDTFHATLNNPLTINGETVVPSGSDIQGHLVDVKSAGKFAGQSQVVLQLDSIRSGGQIYNIQTDQFKKQGSSRGKNTLEKTGAGAGIGALIGALAGGGKGAAIGAAAGGGLGAGSQTISKSQQIKLASETVLNFTLQAPVTVVATNQGPDAGRQKLDANQ
ncbi:MAG: BON domain-containing protein [Acidobacteriaceae bacterium]|nr:BON domain-containing protein [Acidobacteriaceae bacterium]